MKISSISVQSPHFKSVRINATKTIEKEGTKQVSSIIGKAVPAVAGAVALDSLLKTKGFTYFHSSNDNQVVMASGYNGGFYTINVGTDANEIDKKRLVIEVLDSDKGAFGGLMNYRDMVKDLNRQDLIQKGLKIHTTELATKSRTPKESLYAIRTMSKMSGKYIKLKDVFFIENDIFYYDPTEKTAYCISSDTKNLSTLKFTYRTCKFNVDEKGNAIGYASTAMDIFQHEPKSVIYNEQQEPSEELPPIAEHSNNKIFAESFRFGNSSANSKETRAIPDVMNHLSKRVGVKNIKSEEFKFVKFYDKNHNVIQRIAYYDSSIGRSFIYDENGNYRYQMEYVKDNDGQIIACSRF